MIFFNISGNLQLLGSHSVNINFGDGNAKRILAFFFNYDFSVVGSTDNYSLYLQS